MQINSNNSYNITHHYSAKNYYLLPKVSSRAFLKPANQDTSQRHAFTILCFIYDFSSMKTYKMLVIPLCRMLHFDMSEGKHFPKEFLNPQKVYILSEKKKTFLHVLVPVCREAALMTRVGKRFTGRWR